MPGPVYRPMCPECGTHALLVQAMTYAQILVQATADGPGLYARLWDDAFVAFHRDAPVHCQNEGCDFTTTADALETRLRVASSAAAPTAAPVTMPFEVRS